MPADLLQYIPNMGLAGFAILVLWWMYLHAADRLDKKDDAMRSLEREIRENIISQLSKNTAAFERVLDHFGKHK